MSVVVTSLKWDAEVSGAQKVAYDKDGYHLVRFPYGSAESEESYDPWHMHDPANGGTAPSAFPDRRSGLIWPSHSGWGVLSAMVFWAADLRAVEYRARFVRDPLGTGKKSNDSTATTDSMITRGGQYRTFMWQMFVKPTVPLGLKISARSLKDGLVATPITLAEFKLAIHVDVKEP